MNTKALKFEKGGVELRGIDGGGGDRGLLSLSTHFLALLLFH